MTEVPSSHPTARRKQRWALGVTLLSAAANASAEVRGRRARVLVAARAGGGRRAGGRSGRAKAS